MIHKEKKIFHFIFIIRYSFKYYSFFRYQLLEKSPYTFNYCSRKSIANRENFDFFCTRQMQTYVQRKYGFQKFITKPQYIIIYDFKVRVFVCLTDGKMVIHPR